jgi:hypothetical protein
LCRSSDDGFATIPIAIDLCRLACLPCAIEVEFLNGLRMQITGADDTATLIHGDTMLASGDDCVSAAR